MCDSREGGAGAKGEGEEDARGEREGTEAEGREESKG